MLLGKGLIQNYPLQMMGIPDRPFDKIAIDLSTECETSTSGNKHILTIINHLTGWPETFHIPDKSVDTIVPTSNKHKKTRAKKEKDNSTTVIPTEPTIFEWMTKHQEAFDALKEALSTPPVLGYPNLSREFILEIDASLNGLGAVLSQGKDGQICVIAYASCSLHPSERSMRNYISAKVELLVLKWVVTEKFRDYLLGSQFQAYTVNNPLTYVMESKLGASQI